MSRARLPLLLVALVFLTAAVPSRGGWAVLTVDALPDHAVVGKPVDLSYVVRQHGSHLLGGLVGTLVARSGRTEVHGVVTPGSSDGHYTAMVVLPRAGDWSVTLRSGFRASETTLLPLRAVSAGERAPVLALAERGRRLFVAKGCVTCHFHEQAAENRSGKMAPDLTHHPLPADYLARFLADPSIKPPTNVDGVRMPNLGLQPPEIAALVAFVNGTGDRQVSTR